MEFKVGERFMTEGRGEGTVIGIVESTGAISGTEYQVRFDTNFLLPWPFSKWSKPIKIYHPCNMYRKVE